jgi:fucose 4-O-acetylase-like acetyltransferase
MNNCLNQQRLLDLDVMKVIAMILVVFGHVLTNYAKIGYYPDNVWLDTLKSFIYSFHMLAFVFVSGSVYFWSKNKKNKYNNYVAYAKNKFRRLFIPYCFFSVFVVFPVLWSLGLIDQGPFKFFIANFVLSINPRHLWYVLMLFWVMLVFRLFNAFIDRRQWLVMIVSLFLYVLSSKIPNLFQLNTLCRYFVYFYLGYEFLRYKDDIVKYVSFYSFCLFASLSVLLCTLNVTNEYIYSGIFYLHLLA